MVSRGRLVIFFGPGVFGGNPRRGWRLAAGIPAVCGAGPGFGGENPRRVWRLAAGIPAVSGNLVAVSSRARPTVSISGKIRKVDITTLGMEGKALLCDPLRNACVLQVQRNGNVTGCDIALALP